VAGVDELTQRWASVEAYVVDQLVVEDQGLRAARETSRAAGLPDIEVAPNQGAFLSLLTRIAGARRVLEVGTLGGYSSIWLARALPADGRLITLEIDPGMPRWPGATSLRPGSPGWSR
jgi:predicted O-methyltransferase YrrM